jgi:Protein of unknown function (DUF5818)
MKKQFQPLWWLCTLAFLLSVSMALSAQQNTPQGQSTDQQTRPPSAPPTAQPPAPPTSDEPAPPPTSQTQDGSQPGSPAGASPQNGQNGNSAPPPGAQSPTTPNGGTPDQTPAPPPPASNAQGQSAQPGAVQAFSGTIVKEGDRYMLHDDATGQTYDLDHQDEVQKFAGKRVRVHGTRDASGKMIHLQ